MVTGLCVGAWVVAGGEDDVGAGAGSGRTLCGSGSGVGDVAAWAAGASTTRQTKTIALHPAGRPPPPRLDGSGTYCAGVRAMATNPLSRFSPAANPNLNAPIRGVNGD